MESLKSYSEVDDDGIYVIISNTKWRIPARQPSYSKRLTVITTKKSLIYQKRFIEIIDLKQKIKNQNYL